MKVAFRVDASLQMGSGHVMRCLTLANALRERGAECHFICREHSGHMLVQIQAAGHSIHPLVMAEVSSIVRAEPSGLAHAGWLGTTQAEDARQSAAVLQGLQPSWLVVDHYSLDACWQKVLRPLCARVMVIDDLADRTHQCDLLLDQNLGRVEAAYEGLVPDHCIVLAGPEYALLRSEFSQLREYSLARRKQLPKMRNLLISMGGVDLPNATQRILDALRDAFLPELERISVVMGAEAPWLDVVRGSAARLPWRTEVLVNVKDMARRMANCDLAIGAAGGTAWERCCLGVPTVLVVLADNQWGGARALSEIDAVVLVGDVSAIDELPEILSRINRGSELERLSRTSSAVTAGRGAELVVNILMESAQCCLTY